MRDLDVITLALALVFVRVLTAAGQQIIPCKHRESATQFTNNNKNVDVEQRNETSRINILRL